MLRDTAGREGDALIHFLCCGLFNPSVLWTPPLYFVLQNTGEECGYIHCRRAEAFSALTPSPYGHSPYISSKTPRNATGHDRERGGLTLSLLLPVFSTPPSLRATSPIFCVTKHRGGVLNVSDCETEILYKAMGTWRERRFKVSLQWRYAHLLRSKRRLSHHCIRIVLVIK